MSKTADMASTAILVLGMHRSGTSALTAALHGLGASLGGELVAANHDNPGGYFENAAAVTAHETLLAELDRGWEDLRGRTGGTLVHNSFGQQFDAFAKANLNVEEVPSLIQAFQKLLLGRTDYVLYERYPGVALANTQGMLESLETLEPPISSEGLYLTLAHDSACNDPWLRGQLAKKMTELTAAGLPETLLQRNLERWKAQQLQAADVHPQKQEQSQ